VSESDQQLLMCVNTSGALTASVKGAIHAVTGKQRVLNFINIQRKIMNFGKYNLEKF
jgi:fructokinase